MSMESKSKIDPGLCPICGKAICGCIPFNCKDVCKFYYDAAKCYQAISLDTCECSHDDIIIKMGLLYHPKYGPKDLFIVNSIIKKQRKFNSVYEIKLPNELFEI
jgi:hypothetical protein